MDYKKIKFSLDIDLGDYRTELGKMQNELDRSILSKDDKKN